MADGGLSLAIPDSIQLLVSEVSSLGETFFLKTMRKYSVGNGKDDEVIEF